MMKVYTPRAWLSLFGGSPSLVIDDDGYIYSADGYYKIISDNPIGKIDYEKGYIYDKHYSDMVPTPIAYMTNDGDVTKVHEYGKSQFNDPILYIEGGKIYLPEEYLRTFGGNASSYIQRGKGSSGGRSSGSGPSSGSSSNGGAGMPGFAGILGVALIIGIIYLLTSETRIASAAMVLAVAANVGAVVYFLWKVATGGLHFEWSGSRFAKGLVTALAVYLIGTAIFALLGILSNIGTKGSPLSDASGDKMELAAMLLGIPFILNGLLAEGRATGTAKPKQSVNQPYTPPSAAKPKTAQNATAKQAPPARAKSQAQNSAATSPDFSKVFGDSIKISTCPSCGAKFRITVPAGIKRIRATCPNPHCRQQITLDI